MTEKRFWDVRTMALIAVMAAVTCVLGPLSLPIGVVPISFTNLAIYLTVYILGGKRGTVSYLVYLAIGFVGVPVFSGFTGGAGKLLGPTGGYLIGFIFLALIFGGFRDRFQGKTVPCFLGMLLGTAVTYGFGTAWLAFSAGMGFYQALAAGVLPFIPGDIIKMIVSAVVGPQVHKKLLQAGILK